MISLSICGPADHLDQIGAIRHLPVWAFHGDRDMIVPLQDMVKTVETLQACGGNVKFTIYPGVGHNAADPAYAEAELYRWLLSQRRPSEVGHVRAENNA